MQMMQPPSLPTGQQPTNPIKEATLLICLERRISMEGAMLNLPARMEELLHHHGSLLPKGAEDEIPLIKQDLQQIISILHGNMKPKLEDHAMVVRCWMKEVRELSYDIEDCIDQYEYAAATGYRSGSSKVRHRKFSLRLGKKKTPHLPEKLKQRLWMANKMREFSLRSQEAIQRHAMYNLGDIANTALLSSSSALSWHPEPDRKKSGNKKSVNVGMDTSMNKIIDWLTDGEEKLKVVSIVGVAGVGKTTLANELYRKIRWQFECRAFVRTSEKTDMRRILISMLSQVCPHQPPENWKVHSLISSIRTHLQDKRYLIIIEDLWATSTWDIIKCALPESNSSSRILTMTEIEDLALQSCSYDSKYIFKMKPLCEDDSRNLFFNTVFGSRSNCPAELSEVSYDIVRKCGGLPLAVVTIASLLASQLEKREQWDYINKTLGHSLMANPNLEGMKQLLSLCYNNLPQHLKACMLYLSMYQEDFIIWKDDLVNQWIAEGFICAIERDDKEEISKAYFDELLGRKLIQPVLINDNDEVLSCVVHHVVLNFITFKSIEENFIIAIDHSQAITRFADKVRRLSIHFELVRLRYLKIISNVTLKLPTHMEGLKYLETLKIDGKIDGVPSDIIHLPRLFHLSLPAKTVLPSGIAHMTSLHTFGYFDLSCNSTENMQSLGQMTNLRDLELAYSGSIHSDILKENMQCLGSILGKLSNLKSITLSRPGSSYANTLHVSANVLSSLSSPSALLQRLELLTNFCIFYSLPKWTGQLGNLRILKIGVKEVTTNDVDALRELLTLTVLSLYVHTKPAERIIFDKAGFSVLRYFKFRCSVPWLKFETGAMSNLRKLKLGFDVHRADQHDTIPVGIEHLLGLEEISAKIRVSCTSDDLCRRFAESALTNAIRMHPGRPSLNIRCVDWTFGDKDDDNVGTREEELGTLLKRVSEDGSNEVSEVLQKDPREGTHKYVDSSTQKTIETYTKDNISSMTAHRDISSTTVQVVMTLQKRRHVMKDGSNEKTIETYTKDNMSSMTAHRDVSSTTVQQDLEEPASNRPAAAAAHLGGGGAGESPLPSPHGAKGVLPPAMRKRTRAQTTVLTTDTSNFRTKVQEFTGIHHSLPFTSSPSPPPPPATP
uniref:NB-ARC domain-containing protein n=1 Tax=Leersia perrieri TaxID=77586 RepID=A0A0D9XVD9_9ORYZ